MRVVIALALALVVLCGCQPKPVVEEKPIEAERPAEVSRVTVADLSVEPNHKMLSLSWRKLGQGSISGYNIYISERPLAAAFPGASIDPSIQTYNTTPFPGDTIPQDGVEHFGADKLDNGVRYFVTVRVVYPDRSVSAPTNEVITACGARGVAELAVRHSGGNDGFSFDENRYVACDDKVSDLYYYTKDGHDYLASPHRLDAFVRKTGLVLLPWKGPQREVAARLAEAKTMTAADQVEISAGDWVLLRCSPGTEALVNVRELKGTAQQRRVVFSFVYSSLVGEMPL
jgi:hypothetical protein